MHSSILTLSLALSTLSTALPHEKRQDFNAITYPPGTGANLPSYPPGTGANLPSYPPGTGANLPSYPGSPASPFSFTSTYVVTATPDQVVDAQNVKTGGLGGASGIYKFGINSHEDVICYNITLSGLRGEYQSPARTATHVHEAALGKNGPPRLAFPNPTGSGHERYSIGCLKGPFTTGLVQNGKDTGEGFRVAQIEANPRGFFADVHTSLAVAGAVRGQLG